jgi:CheY-like chemotaxis protein
MELVVTDHLMPGLDGPSLVAWMRGDPGFSNIPIVMLSSSGLRGEARSLIPGLAGYLTKPVTEAELLRALLTALRRHPATMQSSPSRVAAAGRGRSLRVLLAEDNVINQKVAVRLLERLGHRVTVVGDGRSVLAALEAQVYDVVLMDVQMPEMDGLEATRAVRAREAELAATGSASAEGSFAAWRTAGCRIPVVALTAHAMKSDEERCLAAGMNGYMAKPVTGEALARALVQFVPMGDLASESPSEEIPACAALLRGPTPRSGRPHGERSTDSPVDLVAALNRVDGDREFLAELGELLVQEWPTRRQELHVALGEGDAGRLERSAHGLKGSLAALGARTASSLAAQLELIARERRLEGAPPVLVELDAELDRTIAFFADPTALREALITPSR